MNSSQVSEFLSMVEAGFDRQYQPQGRKRLAKTLEAEPMEAALSAYKYLEGHPEFRPNPLQLVQLVREHGAKVRERESKQRKKDLPSELPKKTNSEYVKRCMQLINGVNSGKMTRGQILEGFRVMDNLYPDKEWISEGGRLSRFYEKNKYDLEGVPMQAMSIKL